MTIDFPASVRWVAFDLDDTLHYYRKASGRAADAVFANLDDEFGCGIDRLQAAYAGVLKNAQQGAFADGRTAREGRGERFGKLLQAFSIIPDRYLDQALDVYDAALAANLELKEGAAALLQDIERAGRSVMVVTEGPHDAQETTISRLGLAPYVDLLVTSSMERLTKHTGLLQRALDKANCAPAAVIYVGDSVECDIIPAKALGIRVIFVGEPDKAPDGVETVTSLASLPGLFCKA
jgi:putative hydrolase of the HAD superfamily